MCDGVRKGKRSTLSTGRLQWRSGGQNPGGYRDQRELGWRGAIRSI